VNIGDGLPVRDVPVNRYITMPRDTRCGLPDDYITHPFTSLKRLKIQQRGLELNAGN
jgi:hypothetical protein